MIAPQVYARTLAAPPLLQRDILWEHCRNNLGIARLLAKERRPDALVGTACRMATESACRAALMQAALPWDGDLAGSLACLGAPPELEAPVHGPTDSADALRCAERAVAWLAGWLRREAPERSWGF